MPRRRRSTIVGALVLTLLGTAFLLPSATTVATAAPVWTVQAHPPTGVYRAVTFAAGQFVAVGPSGEVATSPDGVTWQLHPAPVGNWTTVTYGQGLYVALNDAINGDREMLSRDGDTWVTTPGPPGRWSSITYGAGHFVAVGPNGAAAVSAEAEAWNIGFSRRADDFRSVSFGNGRFVAVDRNYGDTIVSTNGLAWAFYPGSRGVGYGAVAYGNGEFAAFDDAASGQYSTTVMGYHFTTHTYANAMSFSAATFGCNTFVVVGAVSGVTNEIATMAVNQPLVVTNIALSTGVNWDSVAVGAHRFVALSSAGYEVTAPTPSNCGPTIPSPPQQVSGNVHSQMVWTYQHPPMTAGGAPVDAYKVTISDGVTTKVCYAPQYYEPNCQIAGLTNRHVYSVTAQAHNAYGFSAPSDPEFVIPVPVWRLEAASATSVVDATKPLVVQLTGVLANALGIYPIALVTVHVGSIVTHCYPNVFGECLLRVNTTQLGLISLSASYTGYGKSYVSPVDHVALAKVNVPTSATAGSAFNVQVTGGIPGTLVRLVIGHSSFAAPLNSSGAGTIHAVAPATTAPSTTTLYTYLVSDNAVTFTSGQLAVVP